MDEKLRKFFDEQKERKHSEYIPKGHICFCVNCHQKKAYNLHSGVLSGGIKLDELDIHKNKTTVEKIIERQVRQREYMRKYLKERYKSDPVYREAMKAKANAQYKMCKDFEKSGVPLPAVLLKEDQEIDEEVERQKEAARLKNKEKYANANGNNISL